MKSIKDYSESLEFFVWMPFVVGAYFLCAFLLDIGKLHDRINGWNIEFAFEILSAFVIIAIAVLLGYVVYVKSKFNQKKEELWRQVEENHRETKNEKERLAKQYDTQQLLLKTKYEHKERDLERREGIIKQFVNSSDKETFCAEMIADLKTMVYKNSSDYLLQKVYAAPSAANTVQLLRKDARRSIKELKEYKYKEKDRITQIEAVAQRRINQANEQRDMMHSILNSQTPFKDVGKMVADFENVVFEEAENHLRFKPHPAEVAADTVKAMKSISRDNVALCKEMLYKYEFLLSVFPELKQYVDDEQALLSLAKHGTIQDVSDGYDRVLDYVPKDEYNKLSTIERNQLALDRYKRRDKSDWEIGAEYEMYCDYILRKRGFATIDYGIRYRLEDLGRDIIASKDGVVYIIQCKRWSTNKLIHENVICQLYGTTIEYKIKNREDSLFHDNVVPVLYTTGILSDMATEFAKRLHVQVVREPMGDYPMIKCNINNDKKIYHLPFDQQYYSTHIKNSGEFYAWTVQEAESKGFRRAMRWTEA